MLFELLDVLFLAGARAALVVADAGAGLMGLGWVSEGEMRLWVVGELLTGGEGEGGIGVLRRLRGVYSKGGDKASKIQV